MTSRHPADGPPPPPSLAFSRPAEVRAAGSEIPSDEAIIAAIKAGDNTAWRSLLERHQQRIFVICLRMTNPREASDVCQEAMVKIIAGLPQFDGNSQFLTWATRVTMNVCLTHLRKERLRRHASLDALDRSGNVRENDPIDGSIPDRLDYDRSFDRSSSPTEPDASSRVQSSGDSRLVALGLERLDPEQRAIIVLRDVRGMDYTHIAQALDIAEGTVKSRLFRARAALREIVEQLSETDSADH